MTEWIVYVNGVQVHRYRHTERLTFEQWPNATQVEVPAPAPAPAPAADMRITKFAFRNRFTAAEKVAIEMASEPDKNATAQQRQIAASLRASQQDVLAATFIDLGKDDIRARVQGLEAVGILAAGRATVILDTPPTPDEAWNV